MKSALIKGIPEDLHKDAKIVAVMQGISLNELFIRAVAEYVRREKEKGE